jgi:hypothetical protein
VRSLTFRSAGAIASRGSHTPAKNSNGYRKIAPIALAARWVDATRSHPMAEGEHGGHC